MATGGQEKAGYSLVNFWDLTLEIANDYPLYQGIVACRDKIIVINSYPYQVRLHRLQDGKLLCTHQLESTPRAICIINDMEIGVILDKGQIQIMAVESRDNMATITSTRNLQVQGGFSTYDGVVKFKENLVVCGVKKNTICLCVASLNDGRVDEIHQICKVSKYDYNSYLTTKDNIIYISCCAGFKSPDNGVYRFDILNPSQHKYTYKHEDLFYPGPIAINKDGFIFVCDSFGWNSCIHQLTSKCGHVSIYRQGIPRDLSAIFWDHPHRHLYVTCLGSNVMTIFQPEYTDERTSSSTMMSPTTIITEEMITTMPHETTSTTTKVPTATTTSNALLTSATTEVPATSTFTVTRNTIMQPPVTMNTGAINSTSSTFAVMANTEADTTTTAMETESTASTTSAPTRISTELPTTTSTTTIVKATTDSTPTTTSIAMLTTTLSTITDESTPSSIMIYPTTITTEEMTTTTSYETTITTTEVPATTTTSNTPSTSATREVPATGTTMVTRNKTQPPVTTNTAAITSTSTTFATMANTVADTTTTATETQSTARTSLSTTRTSAELQTTTSTTTLAKATTDSTPTTTSAATLTTTLSTATGDHKAPEALMHNERKQPVIEETPTQKGQGIPIQQSIEENFNQAGIQTTTEERDLFHRFQREIATTLHFSKDTQSLSDAQNFLATAEKFIHENHPDIEGKWLEYKEQGKLTPELIDVIYSKERSPELHNKKEHILGQMEQLDIIIKARSFNENGVKEEAYFFTPCILQQESPEEVISPEQDPSLVNTSVLCWVFTGKILPFCIFQSLLAACLSRWPVAKNRETSDNLIFCGCTVLELDLFHRLTLFSRNHIVFARISKKMGIDDVNTPDAKLCTRVRKFISLNLSKITSCLTLNLQYELRVQNQVSQDVPEDTPFNFSPPFQMWFAEEGHDPDSPITREHMNHARLCVALVTVCGNALREVLLTQFPTPHKDIYQAILANKTNLTRKQGRPLLNPDQIQLVFPDPQGQKTGTVDMFDLSLLYTLIRNVSTVPAPITGWGNDPQDQPRDKSLGASVERIRSYRNHISGHSPDGTISQQDFEDYWNKFYEVLHDIEAVIGSQIYTQDLEKQKRQVISVYEAC